MIDSHVHVWTDDTNAYPRIPISTHYPPPRFTAQEFLTHASPQGVERAVLVQMSFYGFDNSYLVDTMQLNPGRFGGIAVVDHRLPQPELEMRSLADQGIRGFRIQPCASRTSWRDSAGMRRMWQCGAEEQVAMCLLINPEELESLDQMVSEYPDTPVVIDHLARIGAAGSIDSTQIDALCRLSRHPNVFVKVSAMYALGLKCAPHHDLTSHIQQVFEAFGPRRLMWGSDCPFQVQPPHTYQDSLNLIREGLPFLTNDDRHWILEGTAASLFFPGQLTK